MLHITGSMKALKQELLSARGLLQDIIGTLSNVTNETNLTKTVGIFVIQMPEYKILTKDSDSCKQILRKVCSGEIPASKAIESFRSALKEINPIIDMLSDF